MSSENKYKWTVMVYMTGDRSLDNSGFADLKEMKEVGSTEEVALLAQFTRGVKHRPTKRYYLRKGSRNGALAGDVVEELGEKNTADPRVLEDFVRWGVENFPARRYMLVMWGHANGADDENIPGSAAHSQQPHEDSSESVDVSPQVFQI
jgi:cysteine peptidase C11 family protein